LAGLRIQQDNETVDGLSFDLLASHIDEGVWRMDRLAGSVVAPLVEPYEWFSTFRDAVVHGVQTYTAGKAIDSLTLPDTSECNGPLANNRLHDVPSISFDASKPGLNLSSPTSDTNNKSYPVVVEGADSNTLQFAIAGGEAQDKERAKVGLVADFDLDLENDEPEGIAYGDGRVYVVDAGDARVYSYTATGERRPNEDFNLALENDSPTGITFADGILFVVDRSMTLVKGRRLKTVYAYLRDGKRLPSKDFQLVEDDPMGTNKGHSSDVKGIAYGGGSLHVVYDFYTSLTRQITNVYSYRMNGELDRVIPLGRGSNPQGITYVDGIVHMISLRSHSSFDSSVVADEENIRYRKSFKLAAYNSYATGITAGEGNFYVVDASDDKVYIYGQEDRMGSFSPPVVFSMADDVIRSLKSSFNAYPKDLAYADGMFYVLASLSAFKDTATSQICALSLDFQTLPDGCFLSPKDETAWYEYPSGLTVADNRLFVLENDEVYAYLLDGKRDPTSDFKLEAAGKEIVFADDIFYIIEGKGGVVAYNRFGEREPGLDFSLDESNSSPAGITHSRGRFYVVDGSRYSSSNRVSLKVYAYDTDGTRLPERDFELLRENSTASGIAAVEGKFYLIDPSDELVYLYDVGF